MKEKSDFMSAIVLNNCKIHILSVVKGLEKEAEKVKEHFKKIQSELIVVSLSKEDLNVLKNYSGKIEDAEPYNFEEAVYIRELKKYGDVKKPPPCYLAAVELGKQHQVPCRAIDMNDEEYTEAYCRLISTFELYRHSWSSKKFMKRKFSASTPEDFVIEFDKEVTKLNGYRMLEQEREKHMANWLLRFSKDRKGVLAVIEVERAKGVADLLTNP